MATNPRDKVNATRSELTSSNVMQFPASQGAYFSRFSFVKYSRDNPKTQSQALTSTSDLILPLPFNLQEQYSIQYSGADLSWVEGGVKTYEQITANAGTITSGDRDVAEQMLQGYARSTFKDSNVVQQVNRFTGTIVNPHMTNIFQNTNLRTHNFTWQLSPTSQAEALTLQSIVRQFREKMHPTLRSNFILGFPDEVYVTMHGSEFLYPVFKSVVQDVKINYTDGRPNAFFIDGSPVTITLDVTLQEVETLTREDFTTGEKAVTSGTQTTGVK